MLGRQQCQPDKSSKIVSGVIFKLDSRPSLPERAIDKGFFTDTRAFES